eukprot:13742996-Ditylum_brightwellii.AAC.1
MHKKDKASDFSGIHPPELKGGNNRSFYSGGNPNILNDMMLLKRMLDWHMGFKLEQKLRSMLKLGFKVCIGVTIGQGTRLAIM